jgi:hypothetical protein
VIVHTYVPLLAAIVVILALSSFDAEAQESVATSNGQVFVEQNQKARVRVFNGSWITPNKQCFDPVTSQNTLGSALGVFSWFKKNNRVGVPETANMSVNFDEYLVNASSTATIVGTYSTPPDASGRQFICRAAPRSYEFEAGKDYDVEVIRSSGGCSIVVRELKVAQSGAVETTPLLGISARGMCVQPTPEFSDPTNRR